MNITSGNVRPRAGRRRAAAIGLATAMLALTSCHGSGTPTASAPPAAPVTVANQDWPVHGGTPLEQRFSQLTDINESNIGRLGIAWSASFDTNRGQEATPIEVDGVIYVSTAWSKVYAFDAVTGKELWYFDPKVPGGKGVHACCDVVNRGVAVADGRVFVGALDGRLIALDAKTGKQLWSAQTFDPALPYTITGAPRIVKDKVVIGNGGAEYGVRGFVTAYYAATGQQAWRFYMVPGDPKKGPDGAASDDALARIARPTWFGEWWRYGGGGTPWDSIVFDPELNQLYIGGGNSSTWARKVRSAGKGDNLFVGTIVALDPDTGAYRWHFQETPGDQWDFTSTQSMVLADLTIDGQPRKVLLHAPKNGFFYVLDRTNGQFISGQNYVPVNWATGLDPKTGRALVAPEARYEHGPASVYPTPLGAHNWQPMAFDPQLGLAYISANHGAVTLADDPNFHYRPGRWNLAVALGPGSTAPDKDGHVERPSGELIAWDPIVQKARWSVPYLTPQNGGTLATAGNLVFEGTELGQFQAFRASDGTKLWSAPTGIAALAGPITYRIDGVQYVAVVAGAGGGMDLAGRSGHETRTVPSGRIIVYKLDGKGALPDDDSVPLSPPNPSQEKFTKAQLMNGAHLYYGNCVTCHGGYVLPDLRRSSALASAEDWRAIVLGGKIEAQGMANWRGYMSRADVEDIRAFVNSQAQALAAGNTAHPVP